MNQKSSYKSKSLRIILLCLFIATAGYSQETKSFETKFVMGGGEAELLEDAQWFLGSRDYERALLVFLKMDMRYPGVSEYKLYTGTCYLEMPDQQEKAIPYLEEAFKIKPDLEDIQYHLGKASMVNYKFDEAIVYFNNALVAKSTSNSSKEEIPHLIEHCENGKAIMANNKSSQYKLINLGAPVNTAYAEYGPMVSYDETTMLYTFKGRGCTGGMRNSYEEPDPEGEYYEDIYITHNDGNKWSEVNNLGERINSIQREEVIGMSPDGHSLYLYADEKGGDIYVSHLKKKLWEPPVRIEGINSGSWEGHASLAADGKTMYFSSDRPGGFGGKDIYKATLKEGNVWGDVENLGEGINTPYDENSPFIHASGEWLFFSSKGHNSMGGYDVFSAKFGEDKWQDAKNIGPPVNTPNDDLYYTVTPNSKRAYFSSTKKEGKGRQDVYQVEPGILGYQPALALIKGALKNSGRFVEAEIVVTNTTSNEPYGTFNSNAATGHYLVALPAGSSYTIEYKIDEISNHKEIIDLTNLSTYVEVADDFELSAKLNSRIGATDIIQRHIEETTQNTLALKLPEPKLESQQNTQSDQKLGTEIIPDTKPRPIPDPVLGLENSNNQEALPENNLEGVTTDSTHRIVLSQNSSSLWSSTYGDMNKFGETLGRGGNTSAEIEKKTKEVDAHPYNPLNPPNTYRNNDNPQYWKNRKPHEGYWQQDVHYRIKANIDENTDIIDGSLKLTYWNNSSDDMDHVFFHLYQNAFQPGSYYDNLQENNQVKPRYGKYEKQKLGTEITQLKVGEMDAESILDNTILKVDLPETLYSGDSITFTIDFKTYFDNGGVRRRMKTFNSWGYKHYDGVHWYPRISVYDKKFGWTTDQHLGHEFYGDFGTFDVELTFANNFVVGATGFLQNRDTVLPEELRAKLDIKNFANTPWNATPSIITPYDSTIRKTWKYHAENVHDFAFTADPTYRIGEVEWNGIKCISLAQEPHASKWQNAADYTSKIIKIFSEDFGMYVYHKMIVADARDGMEYPMLTLDSGKDPSYRGLLAHEVGHNWFFGQVGNNETYRAALDEGFTQFLTMWALVKIDGEYPVKDPPKSEYVRRYKRPEKTIERRLYNTYIASAAKHSNTTLNTHSDGFNGALRHGGGYRQVYYKTGTMLYNLQYVLGDELFLEAMANYFDQWKICHPYVNDFRNSIIQYTKVDLNWFFDQWLETSKIIDYSVESVKKGEAPNEYLITFRRKGGMQMPLDFEVITKTGDHLKYHIPNNWFEKKTIGTILPKWHGWDKLHPTYTAKITIPAEIEDVVIDPSHRLADANMTNNSKKIPLDIKFDSHLSQSSDWTQYEMFARPEFWYNAYDGIKTGAHLNGHYLKHLHVFDATLWFNTGFAQGQFDSLVNKRAYDRVNFRLNYNTALDKFSPGSRANLSFKLLDGLMAYNIGFEKKDKSGDNRIYLNYQSLARNDSSDLNYLLYPELWNAGYYNNVVNIGLQHLYKYKFGTGNLNLSLRSSAIGSDYNYSQIRFSAINKNNIGKIKINTRTILQAGTGDNPAPESQLYAAGGNPEEMMDNKYIRSEIISDDSWLKYGNTTNHFHHGGGLNLRGFSGYYIAQETEEDSLDIRAVFKGNTGAAFNIELEFQDLLGLRIRKLSKIFSLSSYLFSDLGVINYNAGNESLALSNLRIDAGLGLLLSIKKFGPLEVVNPINLRFDMPFFLNRTPNTDPDFFQFRWILGIGRAF